MNFLKSVLFAALFLWVGEAIGQSGIYLEPRLGAGTFRMKSMKEFQQTLANETGVKAKVVDSFEPYFQFGLGLVKSLNAKTRAGVFVEHGSTGGRVSYKDYSGELRVDNHVTYNALGGLIYLQEPIRHSRFSFMGGIETNIFFSRLKVKGYTRIYDASDSGEEKFNAVGFGFKPNLGLQYTIQNLPIRFTVGYLISASGPFHLPEKPDYYLVRNQENDELEPGWSGLRLNFVVSIPVFK